MSRRAAAAPAPTPRPGTGRSAPANCRWPASVWRRRRGCGGPHAGHGAGRQGVGAWGGGVISVLALAFLLSWDYIGHVLAFFVVGGGPAHRGAARRSVALSLENHRPDPARALSRGPS